MIKLLIFVTLNWFLLKETYCSAPAPAPAPATTTTTKSSSVVTESVSTTSTTPFNPNIHWNYLQDGPDEWPFMFQTCAGSQQSPINIAPSQAKLDSNLKPFTFNNYDMAYDFTFYNNGHSLVLAPRAPSSGTLPSITGSNFNGSYNLLQFHFHWGYSDNQGSEHTWDNMKFPLEVHLVHRNAQGQLTVLGFFFQISDSNNLMLDPIITPLAANMTDPSTFNVTIAQFNILNMIGRPDQINTAGYFRYAGSLTTPPCSEGVVWNVFERKISISSQQMAIIRKNFPTPTYRIVQDLKGRSIFSSRCQPLNKDDVCNGKVVVTTPATGCKSNAPDLMRKSSLSSNILFLFPFALAHLVSSL